MAPTEAARAGPSTLMSVPLKRSAHALLKGEARGVAQVADGGGDVGLGVAHVAGAGRSVLGRDADAFQFLDQPPCLVERDAAAVAGVVHLSRNILSCGCFEVQLGHVFHEGKIAGLLAIPEDDRRVALDGTAQEDRKHTRVGARWVLPDRKSTRLNLPSPMYFV